jgi:hypothetical protein
MATAVIQAHAFVRRLEDQLTIGLTSMLAAAVAIIAALVNLV